MTNETGGGWNEWSKYVLKELTSLTTSQETLKTKVEEHTIEIAKLKLKFAIYGSIAAFIGTVIINLVFHFIK